MSEKTVLGHRKEINGFTYFLSFDFDLTHGRGWFARIIDNKYKIYDSFDKHSKFTAIRKVKEKRIICINLENICDSLDQANKECDAIIDKHFNTTNELTLFGKLRKWINKINK